MNWRWSFAIFTLSIKQTTPRVLHNTAQGCFVTLGNIRKRIQILKGFYKGDYHHGTILGSNLFAYYFFYEKSSAFPQNWSDRDVFIPGRDQQKPGMSYPYHRWHWGSCSLTDQALQELTVVDYLRELKRSSSKWIKIFNPKQKSFAWQKGYGVFSISAPHVEPVKKYIANQKHHHHRESFQDEFRRFCKRYDVEIDERFVWDWGFIWL